jgi:endonuclease/exonuclease/phosphatase family metal-dependent hydrolase
VSAAGPLAAFAYNAGVYPLPVLLWMLWTPAAPACPFAAEGAAPEVPLSVVTLNAWGLPRPVASDRRGRLPRIAGWLEERGYDVAGLQEMWRGAMRLFPWSRGGLTAPQAGGDSGLAILTPHEVQSKRLHAYEAERGFDTFKAKGLLLAELAVDDGREVTVGVTHLQAGGGRRNAEVRALQVDEMLTALGDSSRATVLLGDFNLYAGEPVDQQTWQRLEAEGFVDVAAVAGATGGTYPGRADRFDRIYVRDGAQRCWVTRSAEVLESDLSDHRAVEAVMSSARRRSGGG